MKDKIILITGANRGIGHNILKKIATYGYTVIGTSRSKDGADLITETLKDSAEVLKKLPELPQMMEKANQALTFLASGQIPQNSNSYSAMKNKELEMKSFRNQSIIGLLLLVFIGFIVF